MFKDKVLPILKSVYSSMAWIAVILLIVDLITKWVVQLNFQVSEMEYVIDGFFYITLIHNTGAAWGAGAGDITFRVVYIIISLAACVGLIVYYVKKYAVISTFYKIVGAIIFAGAFGNLIDRAFYWEATVGFSGVIDMIGLKFGDYYFPIFNVADMCVVIGSILILIKLAIEEFKNIKQDKDNGKYELPPLEYEERMKKSEENSTVESDTNLNENERN